MAHEFVLRSGLRLFDGVFSTGNEQAPDVVSGGICLYSTASGKLLTFKANGIAHGITDEAETDTYAAFQKEHDTLGGLHVSGYSGNSKALTLFGYASTTYTGVLATSQGTVVVDAYKKSGTSATALDSDENIFAIRNGGTTQVIVKGAGDIYLRNGGLRPGENAAALAGMLRYVSSTPDIEFYDGSAWVSLTAGGGGSPGGSNTQLQYNNSGSFGGASAVTYDAVNSRLHTGDVVLNAANYFYLGDPDTDGSWRFKLVSGNIDFEKRVSGAWVGRHSFR